MLHSAEQMFGQKKYVILLLVIFKGLHAVFSQSLELDSIYNITRCAGDDLFPQWSSDGTQLLFQSNRSGNWDIYKYNLNNDSLNQLTRSGMNERYPVWFHKQNAIVFSSNEMNSQLLYQLNLETGERGLLIKREIYSQYASFPESEYLVYILGLDPVNKHWGLYRYEFRYNSLKFMKALPGDKYLPKVTADGESIMYVSKNNEKSVDQLNIINWYGKLEHEFSDYSFIDPSWYPGGLKIIFISDMDNGSGDIYTIWKDGSHLERWTNNTLTVKNPVVSPTGKHLVVSVLSDEGFDLYVIPLEDY